MDDIFVVMGSHGEYSDRCEWLVGWTDSEAQAQDLVVRLQECGRSIEVAYENACARNEWEKASGILETPIPLDLNKPDCVGVPIFYWVETVRRLPA